MRRWGAGERLQKYIQQQWQGLGVSLPREVVGFQVDYCQQVEIEDGGSIDDRELIEMSDRVESLSEEFGDSHQAFNQNYFADLSFLISGLMFGINGAVQKKFTVVRDLVTRKDRSELDRTLNELPDRGGPQNSDSVLRWTATH
ncbi:MAG: hypothetical protein L3J03_04125 [Desulfobacterales bacterium]|nr:hypothetical protein [Desulfobacterales bacterium]